MTIAKTVARLDYSRPPPGYEVSAQWWRMANARQHHWAGTLGYEGVSAAWTYYKAHNDPPGIETVPTMGQGAAFVMPGSPLWAKRGAAIVLPWVGKFPSARVAAWAWHDRRHALTKRGPPSERALLDVWPRCLTWTDEQVAEVEHWLADSTAEIPAVLR